MKKILVYLLYTFPQLLLAQADGAGTEHNLRAGDELSREVVIFGGSETNGRDVVWDLQDMEVLEGDYLTCYTGADVAPWLVAAHEGLASRQYLSTADGISLLGRSTPTSQMTYDIPEQLMRLPLCYGDSITGIYGGAGSYGDKLFVREYGNYRSRVDGTGSMLLPDGDTLRHVCLLTTDRMVWAETALADSMQMVYGDSIPAYGEDSIRRHLATDVPLQRVREQRWYAAGYRYPILETVESRSAADDRLITKYALYYSPAEQERQLAYDEESEAIRTLIARGEYHPEGLGHDTRSGSCEDADPVIDYTLEQNAEARTVTIRYSLESSATVRCVLADSKGVVYRTAEQTNAAGTGYSLALSYSGLPHGQYVVYISAGGLTQAVKFSAK